MKYRRTLSGNQRGSHRDIVPGYSDVHGKLHFVSSRTRRAIAGAIGSTPAETILEEEIIFATSGRPKKFGEPCEILLEDGTRLRSGNARPLHLPDGYHTLHLLKSARTLPLIAAPTRCWAATDACSWGVALQLYALRSAESWGIGDFADMRDFSHWLKHSLHAGFVMPNPFGACQPIQRQEPSPYYPSSRLFLNPLYIRVEEVDGFTLSNAVLERCAKQGRALNGLSRIERNAVFRQKLQALRHLWCRFGGDARFDRYCAESGEPLLTHAVYCAIAEKYGTGWNEWPHSFQSPRSGAVKQFAREHASGVEFHRWLQWLLDKQLAAAAAELPLIRDMPVGVDPSGSDAWRWNHLMANGVKVGAPPDEFNSLGQDWGFVPFIPSRLRAAAYEPFRQTVQAQLRYARGLRIDHVMGLFRLFWIPDGAGPRDGAYVRYRHDELLAILALESNRAKAVIIGEDLGTVEPSMRRELRKRSIFSSRVLWFEKHPASSYPKHSLASITTHDLPTVAGLWSGADLAEQLKYGLESNIAGLQKLRRKIRRKLSLTHEEPVKKVLRDIHKLLAQSASVLRLVTLEDMLAVRQRPNLPGSISSGRNWSVALSMTLEQIKNEQLPREIARIMRNARGPATKGGLRPGRPLSTPVS